jgi:hypothetical protein
MQKEFTSDELMKLREEDYPSYQQYARDFYEVVWSLGYGNAVFLRNIPLDKDNMVPMNEKGEVDREKGTVQLNATVDWIREHPHLFWSEALEDLFLLGQQQCENKKRLELYKQYNFIYPEERIK